MANKQATAGGLRGGGTPFYFCLITTTHTLGCCPIGQLRRTGGLILGLQARSAAYSNSKSVSLLRLTCIVLCIVQRGLLLLLGTYIPLLVRVRSRAAPHWGNRGVLKPRSAPRRSRNGRARLKDAPANPIPYSYTSSRRPRANCWQVRSDTPQCRTVPMEACMDGCRDQQSVGT